MKKNLKFYISLVTLLSSTSALAVEAIPVLNRSVPYQGQWKDVELWGQFDYSGKDLDFFGVADKGDTSYIDSHVNYLAGLNIGLYKGLSLRYSYLYSDQQAVRASIPKEINTQYDGHDVRLEYSWNFKPTWALTGQVGFRNHSVSPTGFSEFQSGGFTLARSDNSNVIDIKSTDTAAILGINLSKSFSDNTMQITAGLEARFVDINPKMTSPLTNEGGFLADIIEKELPQQSPWQEQHLIASAAFEWQMWEYVSVAMDFKHYQIWRENYQPKAGKQDYNSNQQFDFYLFGHVYKGLTLYGHAQIMTHYLLGEVPLVYNTRTNHRFNKAYGFISGGLSYSF